MTTAKRFTFISWKEGESVPFEALLRASQNGMYYPYEVKTGDTSRVVVCCDQDITHEEAQKAYDDTVSPWKIGDQGTNKAKTPEALEDERVSLVQKIYEAAMHILMARFKTERSWYGGGSLVKTELSATDIDTNEISILLDVALAVAIEDHDNGNEDARNRILSMLDSAKENYRVLREIQDVEEKEVRGE